MTNFSKNPFFFVLGEDKRTKARPPPNAQDLEEKPKENGDDEPAAFEEECTDNGSSNKSETVSKEEASSVIEKEE